MPNIDYRGRGDSPETIKQVYDFLMRCPKQGEQVWFDNNKSNDL